MDKLVKAIDQIFNELGINRLADWKHLGGRAGVGAGIEDKDVEPMWTKAQLGLLDGTAPRTLRDGDKAIVDMHAVQEARKVFEPLLGPMTGPLQATRPMGAVDADILSRVVPKAKAQGTTRVPQLNSSSPVVDALV